MDSTMSCASRVCVYSKLKEIQQQQQHHKNKHKITSTSASATYLHNEQVDEVVDYAIGVVKSITTASVEKAIECHARVHHNDNSWLVSRIRLWQNPMMSDTKSIMYLFKQVVKHIDLLYNNNTTNTHGSVQFTNDDCMLYITVLEEYRHLLKQCK